MDDQSTIRWGVAGTGSMASVFVDDFRHVDGAEVVAVGSRDAERGRNFASRRGIAQSFGSYRELCASPDVDIVYVATPHPQHKAIALEAIRNHKAVLVEKAFTATLAGAQEVVDAATAEGVFCMEAMWTRFQPVARELRRIVDAGKLGPIRTLQGGLLTHREFDESDRLFAPELGGGALLDLGVYPISFAHDLLGMPDEFVARGTLFDNGVDAQASMLATWSGGQLAALSCGLQASGPNRLVIVGDKGWAEVAPPFHCSSKLLVHRTGVPPREMHLPLVGNGYSHEIEHVNQCLREGRLQSDIMPLKDTLEVMELLESATTQVGVHHVEDDLLV